MEVLSWSVVRIKGWLTYFQVRADLEKEALEATKRKRGLAGKGRK